MVCMMRKTTKTLFGLLGLAGAAAAAGSEAVLYLVSNAHADLSFLIKKTKETEEGKKKEEIRHRNMEWLSQQDTEEFHIESQDGLKLRALYLEAPGSNRIAFCIHGIQTTGEREFATLAKYFYENGISSFIIDQRAHGKSEGKYLTYGDKEAEDCKKWLDFIAGHFGPSTRIFVYGLSMGSSTTLLLNRYELPENVEYLVADCGYSSIKAQLKNTFSSIHLPAGLCYFLYKCSCRLHHVYNPDKVDIMKCVRNSRLPIIFIHGAADDVVPVENAYNMYEECGSEKKLVITEGLKHTESFVFSEEARQTSINGF